MSLTDTVNDRQFDADSIDRPRPGADLRGGAPPLPKNSRTNVGENERTASVVAGAVLAGLGLARRSVPGLLIAGVGGAMLYRGLTGHCHLYDALGIDTSNDSERGLEIEESVLIDRPADQLYQYWRNFTNLPRIMTYLESVQLIDERRSHWVAHAPKLLGGQVEWDAEIVRDEPNVAIAWKSLPDSQVESSGEVRFAPALGNRGTHLHVSMKYSPPAGRLGPIIATLTGQHPKTQIREGLRTFKRIMEVGEAPTIVGQPRGTCTGQGIRTPASRDDVRPNM